MTKLGDQTLTPTDEDRARWSVLCYYYELRRQQLELLAKLQGLEEDVVQSR